MTTYLQELLLEGLPLFRRGKVRDTYDLGDNLLMVATDRVSAFDVVLSEPVPNKGAILTGMSTFWFELTRDLTPNHVVSTDVCDLPEIATPFRNALDRRFMIVKKAERIDIECVVRGYLAGSGWAEYKQDGAVCEEPLPAGLVESSRLDKPIFTPAAKNDSGHDENISIARMEAAVGKELTDQLKNASLALYGFAERYARKRGIIIADTKFEFGFINGQLTIIDEMLTPDSSRFWDVNLYEAGRPQDSFDKQPLRDWLMETGWDRNPPAPSLPASVIQATADRYRTAFERLTEMEFTSNRG
ncbi:phosphoribosylaminoimidazolesuccinocarboxamide synthase [soil metagenome]